MAVPGLRIALLFGGPSPERGISLNSARSVADHLEGAGIVLAELLYVDGALRAFAVSRGLLYSNTPDDFDFKLSVSSSPLTSGELAARLRGCDLAFPVMHGEFGEDGGVQRLLEDAGVAYVGSTPEACAVAYDKHRAQERLAAAGIATVPHDLLRAGAGLPELPDGVLVSKPTAGGSSLGVTVHWPGPERDAGLLRQAARYGAVIVQPWVAGVEVTTVVVEGGGGPVALIPVEVELRDRSPHQILSYRHKYLPSDDARYHCPPRFAPAQVDAVRAAAERAFTVLGLRDFARIDAWLTDDGRIVVSDVNPVSGMEQNSFLFIQAAQAGMTHRDALRLVVSRSCDRSGLAPPLPDSSPAADREPIPVLLGGTTAERQVSVLSGTNVWLKLVRSARYQPEPALLDADGSVWMLSYPAALRHTVEEIRAACEEAAGGRQETERLTADIHRRLGLQLPSVDPPRRVSLDELVAGRRFVFNALHGGAGEDGTMQRRLDQLGVAYNGSGPEASALAMDKELTGVAVAAAAVDGVGTAPRLRVGLPASAEVWDRAVTACGTATLVVKPLADGCSAGVVPLRGRGELAAYLDHLQHGSTRIPAGTFSLLGDDQVVELPPQGTDALLLEAFIETDRVAVVEGGNGTRRLDWRGTGGGWVEVTVGLVGTAGSLHALPPSMTVATAGVLSLEEKFMGGTGVNITPPPPPPLGRIRPEAVATARRRIEAVAEALGIEGYARVDAFLHAVTGEVIVIEANTLPALTPSTVLYHQALADDPPRHPRELLEEIIELGLARHRALAATT